MIIFDIEDNQSIDFDEYFAIDTSESIGTDHFIFWSFSKSIGDAYMDVFIVNAGNYSNFVNHLAHIRYTLALSTDPSGSGFFTPPYDDIWHVVFHNVDSPLERSITVSYKIEFDEKYPQQNDGNNGDDAGNTIGSALYLYEDDYACSGMLVYQDYWDFYKFYVHENDSVTISVSGLSNSNCNFYLIDPILYENKESRENIASDFEIILDIDVTGFWIIEFNKTNYNYPERETYNLQIEIDSTYTNTSGSPSLQSGYPFSIILTISLLSLISIIVLLKKRKPN
ncbi:MAG: hypothetical protein FK731_05180 [Asgard group archaeon]|nr:hypothetical protein [Asgard group archaeon]